MTGQRFAVFWKENLQTSVEPLKWNRNITYKNERIIKPVPSVHICHNQIFKTNTETEKCSE